MDIGLLKMCEAQKEFPLHHIAYSSVNIVFGLGLRKKTRKKKCDATAGLHDLGLCGTTGAGTEDVVQILFVSMCHSQTSAYAGAQLFRNFDPSQETVVVS